MTNSINQGVFSSLPKEVGSLIFSYLGIVEKGTASKVCKYWKELLQPKLLEMLHVSKLEQRKIISNTSNTDLSHAGSFLLLNNKEAYLFYNLAPWRLIKFDMSQVKFSEIQEVNEMISSKLGTRFLDETEQYLFFASHISLFKGSFEKLICIQKDNGQLIFEIARPATRSYNSLPDFLHFAVLQTNPLKFLLISGEKIFIYSFIMGNIKEEKSFLHKLEFRTNQAYYVGNNEIIFYYRDHISLSQFAIFNIETKQIVKSNLKDHSVLDFKLLVFLEKSNCGIAVKRFESVDGHLKQIYQMGFVNSEAYVFQNLLFIIDSFEIRIFDARDCKSLFTLKLPDEQLFGEVHLKKNLKARVFTNKVALMAGPLLILIDLKTGSNVLKEFNENINLVDCNIKHGVLYVLYDLFGGARFDALKLQEVSLNEPSLAELPSFDVKTNVETVFESPVEQVKDEIPPSNHNTYQKTALIALLIITSSLLGLSIYFGMMRSINLSIGLGTASALTGAGAGYAALKVNQKNKL